MRSTSGAAAHGVADLAGLPSSGHVALRSRRNKSPGGHPGDTRRPLRFLSASSDPGPIEALAALNADPDVVQFSTLSARPTQNRRRPLPMSRVTRRPNAQKSYVLWGVGDGRPAQQHRRPGWRPARWSAAVNSSQRSGRDCQPPGVLLASARWLPPAVEGAGVAVGSRAAGVALSVVRPCLAAIRHW